MHGLYLRWHVRILPFQLVDGKLQGGDVALGSGNIVPSGTASSLHVEMASPQGAMYIELCADVALANCAWVGSSAPDLRQVIAGDSK